MWFYYFIGFLIFVFLFISLRVWYFFYLNSSYKNKIEKVIFEKDHLLFSDGTKLQMIFEISARTDVFIIFNHGFGVHLHDLDWLVEYAKQKKYSLLIYSRRNEGHNVLEREKAKKFHAQQNVDDCLNILETLQNKYVTKKFIMIGHSFGGAITSFCAKSKRTKNLNCCYVLLNSPNNFNSFMPHNFIEQNLISYLHLVFIMLFNKNLQPHINHRFYSLLLACDSLCSKDTLLHFDEFTKKKKITKKDVEKYLFFNHHQIHFYSFFYFFTMFFLLWKSFSNLSKNKWNDIFIFQGEFDNYATIKFIQKKAHTQKNNSNQNFYFIKNFDHGFHTHAKKNQIILNDIINIVLKKKINFKFSSISKIK